MLRALVATAFAFTAASAAVAQGNWPSKPITIVVPFGAGGNTDVMARLTATHLTKVLGTSVVVDNKPGASGLIAARQVLGQPADGHTLFMATATQVVTAPFVNASFNFDPLKEFAPVVNIGANAFVITTRASLPAKNLGEFVELAKKEPGKITYGSGGAGALTQLSAFMFGKRAGIDMTHVPYKGGAAVITDLIGGQIDMYSASPSEVIPQLSAGKIRLLAISSPARLKELPNVPTIAETYPGYEVSTWNGLVARAGTPAEVLDRIASEVAKMKDDPAILKKLEDMGVVPMFVTRAAFGTQIQREVDMWSKVLKNSGIRAD
ncbi:tripartite tricarboxylate transporter substrate binding protein [Diaphorobacter sp. HDW4A]|uniref:Bug family tripartite tricarboxylate transporter substrate binding protein n=1 Tax=Diaphorobacter sp. HDW4A TaxID=2714924 RepID=UPI0014077AF5|nr:tripartite tricarboxylate transporter substrate binding protein [Diaphorobacter sp. HDW4A]QIL79996.1 tripartite tricarboxylate transporter substrate binding protein [Diaphorobacter sp. HDW4A]